MSIFTKRREVPIKPYDDSIREPKKIDEEDNIVNSLKVLQEICMNHHWQDCIGCLLKIDDKCLMCERQLPKHWDISSLVRECKQRESDKGEKWIWVTGYKILDGNMQSNFHYEKGVEYSIDGNAKAEEKGFYLSLTLKDCLEYYDFTGEDRLFKVLAKVKERDYFDCRDHAEKRINYTRLIHGRLVANKISIIEELDLLDEIKCSKIGIYKYAKSINQLPYENYSKLLFKKICDLGVMKELAQNLIDGARMPKELSFINCKTLYIKNLDMMYEEVEAICNENQDPNDRFYFLCQLLCRIYKWDVCQEHTYYV
ncbi:MAG: hypothetical protein ACLTBR_03110 [Anaerostipes sp.]|uniref:DUF7666 domain-containing protein n=1 Tax=Anaerostipes sp. TaxID=1872530 RepID=UPI0039945561